MSRPLPVFGRRLEPDTGIVWFFFAVFCGFLHQPTQDGIAAGQGGGYRTGKAVAIQLSPTMNNGLVFQPLVFRRMSLRMDQRGST